EELAERQRRIDRQAGDFKDALLADLLGERRRSRLAAPVEPDKSGCERPAASINEHAAFADACHSKSRYGPVAHLPPHVRQAIAYAGKERVGVIFAVSAVDHPRRGRALCASDLAATRVEGDRADRLCSDIDSNINRRCRCEQIWLRGHDGLGLVERTPSTRVNALSSPVQQPEIRAKQGGCSFGALSSNTRRVSQISRGPSEAAKNVSKSRFVPAGCCRKRDRVFQKR